MKLKKTRHFRLDETLERKLMHLCSISNRSPSETIRHLIRKEKSWAAAEGVTC